MENKKVFSGGKPVCMQINNSIDRLNKIMNIIESSDKSPEIYLTEQLFEDFLEAEFILKNTEVSYGKQVVDSFHIDFIQKVIKVLNVSIQFNEISLESIMDENGYYSIIVNAGFLDSIHPIIIIYPYFKKFEFLESDRYEELILLEKEKLEKISKIEEEIDFINKCYENPALYAGDDIKLFIKMQNKNKKETILNQELIEINETLQEAKNELFIIQDEINELNNALTSIYITRDRYAERLQNRFGYKMLREEIDRDEELEKQEINLFNQSLIDTNENKDFFSNMMMFDEQDDNIEIERNEDENITQVVEIEEIDEDKIANDFNFFNQ